MSWMDSLGTIIGGGLGAVGGSFVGNPMAGAALGAGIGSSIQGAGQQSKASSTSQRNIEDAIKRIYGVDAPSIEELKLKFGDGALQDFAQTGTLSPDQESYLFGLPPPTMSLLAAEDAQYLDPQLAALSKLGNIANAGGMDAQAMSAMEQARMGNATAARGAREANLQNAAQRGVSGSGLEFTSNQMADQNAANNNNLYGLQQAGQANERTLSALNQMSNLAGNMSERDLGLELHRADAQDEMNKLSANFLRDAQARNVDRTNTAQAQNLAEKQRIADQNVASRNATYQFNQNLPQKNFENEMKKADSAGKITTGTSEAQAVESKAAGNLWGGIGQGLTGTAGALFAQGQKDSTAKDLAEIKKKMGIA